MPLPLQQAAQRLTGDNELIRKNFVSGLKLQQQKKLKKALSATALGPSTQNHLFRLANDGHLAFASLLQVLNGERSLQELIGGK